MQNDLHRSDVIKERCFCAPILPPRAQLPAMGARFSHSTAAQAWLRFPRKLLTGEEEPWKSTEQSHEDGSGNPAGSDNVIETGTVSSARSRREKH